jgi:hypothetical protein
LHPLKHFNGLSIPVEAWTLHPVVTRYENTGMEKLIRSGKDAPANHSLWLHFHPQSILLNPCYQPFPNLLTLSLAA